MVLAISGIKDGYEDIKRHQSDRHINLSHVRVLAGGAFKNANPMHPKERSFSKLLEPIDPRKKWRRPKPTTKNTGAAPDVELAEGAGVPEVINSAPVSGDPNMHDIEFDEEGENPIPLERTETSRLHNLTHRHRDPSNPHWKRTAWEDVKVGDFVKIRNDESFPADILICATSEEENVCFVETKNLDGETNLKSRNAVPALTHLRNAEACTHASFSIELDRPDPNMYKLHGAVITSEGKQPLDLQTVLLRGTLLRNTEWVIGVIMFTGIDTKIILNSGGTPSKRSKVERQMNPQVYVFFSRI